MQISQIKYKNIAIFGNDVNRNVFIDYLLKQDIKVFLLDENNQDNIDVTFVTRDNINWDEIDYLIILQDDKILIEMARKNKCSVISIVEFFQEFYPENNYIALIGESGATISSDIIKYMLCKTKVNIDYDLCAKDNLFSITHFGDTVDYISVLNNNRINLLQSPHFNKIILFDLDFNKKDIEKIKKMILNQNENDYLIINLGDKDLKEFYNSLKDAEDCKTNIIPISTNKILKGGVSFINNEMYVDINNSQANGEYLGEEFKNLTGEQNRINILAVFTLSLIEGVKAQEIFEVIRNFKTHNDVFETVIHRENFIFINDINNKNKNQSLKSFENIYWILCVDDVNFEFDKFLELAPYLKNVKYVFILGDYDEEVIKVFRENEVKYFIMYSMENILQKIEELMKKEELEESITVLLSSINDIEDNAFYKKSSEEFEKLLNLGEQNESK